MNMKAKTILTLVGVSCITCALCNPNANESEDVALKTQPMGLGGAGAGEGKMETPEVVLQLKYDKGELDRIYLTQFRQRVNEWVPSVPTRRDLCADLCHAGLGGDACGTNCPQMIPVGLQSALSNGNQSEVEYGEPRVYVCPTLCNNHLGEPLCSCAEKKQKETEQRMNVDWKAVCAAFCVTDGHVLAGCPSCRKNDLSTIAPQLAFTRVLNTAEGWSSWCNVQCRQGQGGAACNCDRGPFQ